MSALNLDCFVGSDREKIRRKYDEARGFSEVNGEGSFNGGIINPQREHLRLGQIHFRFVSAKDPHDRKIGGQWWIDGDTMNGIWQRYRRTGPNDRMAVSTRSHPSATAFREWLALTYSWNLIEEIVLANFQKPLDCYSGFGRQAEGNHVMDSRKVGYPAHLSNLFTIKQRFIPELWRHVAAACPIPPRVVPIAQIHRVLDGSIRWDGNDRR